MHRLSNKHFQTSTSKAPTHRIILNTLLRHTARQTSETKATPALRQEAWHPWILGLLLAVAVFLAYSNTLRSPFVYDDYTDLIENTSIRRLWPLKDVFYTSGKGFLSRPFVNLTFAIDYAIGGLRPFIFHCTNLLIHLGAALALLGIMRRALVLPIFEDRFKKHVSELALVIAACWALHPLATEAVSYITQRYESAMSLFVLVTFYSLLRSLDSARPVLWQILASISCLLALSSKEVAVSLPLLIVIFDRIFLANSFKQLWTKRKILYVGMLCAWIIFAIIQIYAVKRSFAGFELRMPWWRYAINQPAVMLHYLHLAIWPRHLVLDYFWPEAKAWKVLVPGILSIATLLGFTLWSLSRKPTLGFLPLFFFTILAPTSSVMPILDLAVEHRMYLPLAAVIIAITIAIHTVGSKVNLNNPTWSHWSKLILLSSLATTCAALGIRTYLRNEDYRNPLDLWRSVTETMPNNPRGHNNYAFCLAEAGYLQESLKHYEKSVTLAPRMSLFHSNYGVTLARAGEISKSIDELRVAVTLEPTNSKYLNQLGFVLFQKGSADGAMTCFQIAHQLNPRDELSYAGFAVVSETQKRYMEAKHYVLEAIKLNPYHPSYRLQLIRALLNLGDYRGARAAFKIALQLESSAEKISDLGWTVHERGMDPEAILALRQALRMKPDAIRSQIRLAWILATSPEPSLRNGPEALHLTEQALASQPIRSQELLGLLAVSLAESGRFQDAQKALQEALAQAKTGQEPWIPQIKSKLALFKNHQAYHEPQKAALK